ncbi:short-chain dehydrogenase [Leptolyngbya sp. 'hensonii']|uniref:bifunctional sterol desaturase/short chain dehydrogenase n=1 Tax=Leptolyngbya sp. 'hensonii' TaxID=1922337 RepID=UPI00094F6CDF|nr:bifunctional sterol desaturase/short chain dehydrogenase [Leptolyngbya sp. 'hensonii']OLP17300.1 short-chain dehydrogenase [Leptolyngbya sp. 'hensonii']
MGNVLNTSSPFQGKVIAITGASGTLGRALIRELSDRGARVIGLTTSAEATFDRPIEVLQWHLGQEAELGSHLETVDILILNHGINVYSDRSPAAIQKSLEVNTLSVWRWLELFLKTVSPAQQGAMKEVWVNTSEAEVGPALSPLYEWSKRAIGDLITLRRLDAPCTIRKLILGPFKSQLNPYGVMSASWVAWAVVSLAQRGVRDIIITVNPLTYLFFPLKEAGRSRYFRLFSRPSLPEHNHG